MKCFPSLYKQRYGFCQYKNIPYLGPLVSFNKCVYDNEKLHRYVYL